MAALLVQRVWKKKGMVQTTILAMELLLLSTGFLSALFKLKQAAINPYCCLLEFALSVPRQLGMSYRVVFSSPLHILFITSIIVVLILVSSRFHLPKLARLEFEYYDVFVGNLMEEDSLFNVSTERWEAGKIVAEDDAPRSEKESKETRTAASSSNINGITAKVIVFESDVQDDDGEVSLKDVHVDCFRTLSGTWRVAASTVDDEMPHLQKIPKSYGIETAATGINLKFSDENERPEEENLMFSDENQRAEAAEEEDTMEATWIAISQGRECREKNNKNNNMKLKKSETWLGVARRPEPQSAAAIGRSDEESSLEATWKELRKSVTFNDAVSACRRGGLARDLMTTSDEMKKRFDDFINNFNNDLRLQRQESEQRLLAAITRGGLPVL